MKVIEIIMTEEKVKVDDLIDTLMRRFEVHGFQPQEIEQTLLFLYHLGWRAGFHEGIAQDLKTIIEKEKVVVEPKL